MYFVNKQSTQFMAKSATITVHNTSAQDGWIIVHHKNASHGLKTKVWHAKAGKKAGSFKVSYETGKKAKADDQWWVYFGAEQGKVYTSGKSLHPEWKAHALTAGDHGKTATLEVSDKQFKLTTAAGKTTRRMASTGMDFTSPITHVFVLMLENHSLDNMLGLSGIPGITPMTTANSNTYKGTKYYVSGPAPVSMTTDPGHEFDDVLQQLTNKAPGTWQPPLGPYPKILPKGFADRSGYAANYATATDEDGPLPSPQHYGDTMKCFQPGQLPVINALANEFAVCSQWFSSLPGPTWPNRFFLHCASSNGMDCSPTSAQITEWEAVGFATPKGSIYDKLTAAGLPYRIYRDYNDKYESNFSDDPGASGGLLGFGYLPQVTVLPGLHLLDTYPITDLPGDLSNGYTPAYTFIEPHYGNIRTNTYAGGSSQHPMDDVYGGEGLLKYVYESIRNSPIWNSSLLIVTYDEHGGFYDSVPPVQAPPPADGSPAYGQPGSLNTSGFLFDQYGVRVPAVIISPWIAKNTVDNTVYDHTSVLATVEKLFGLSHLTERDRNAARLLPLLTEPNPRRDCPKKLPNPVLTRKKAKVERIRLDALVPDMSPVPESGNLVGALGVLYKADKDLATTPAAKAAADVRFQSVKTLEDAKRYAEDVQQKVETARARRGKK